MKLTSPRTFEVIKWVLKLPLFSQRLVYKNSAKYGDGVSVGQVNNVFQWLGQMGFIERKRVVRNQDGVHDDLSSGRYELVNPTGLLRAVSYFRTMDRNRVARFDLDISTQQLLSYLKDKDVTFCLDSALGIYDTHFRPDRVCFYVDEQAIIDDIKQDLSGARPGLTRCEAFMWDFRGLDIKKPINSEDGATTKIQTIIDLFCNDRAYYTKELIRSEWEVAL